MDYVNVSAENCNSESLEKIDTSNWPEAVRQLLALPEEHQNPDYCGCLLQVASDNRDLAVNVLRAHIRSLATKDQDLLEVRGWARHPSVLSPGGPGYTYVAFCIFGGVLRSTGEPLSSPLLQKLGYIIAGEFNSRPYRVTPVTGQVRMTY